MYISVDLNEPVIKSFTLFQFYESSLKNVLLTSLKNYIQHTGRHSMHITANLEYNV